MALKDDQKKERLHNVAVLLTLIGREAAQEVIKQFPPDEIERISREMIKCESVDSKEGEEVLREFFRAIGNSHSLAKGGAHYVEDVLAPAMDPERAQRLLRKLRHPDQVVPFDDFRDVPPAIIIDVLKEEHPQTMALVISNLPSDVSAHILHQLPEKLQQEVAKRIATLDQNVPDMATIHDIEDRLRERIKQEEAKPQLLKIGGVQTAADILNQLDKQSSGSILETIESGDEELANAIKMRMVRMEDLVKLNDMEVQRVLKEVETQDLAVACNRLDAGVQDLIFRNMSSRGAEMLKDDIEVMENVKPEAIREARRKIAEIMRRLDEEGSIMLNKQTLEDDIV
jgi:flagellar motor switch protein FliG